MLKAKKLLSVLLAVIMAASCLAVTSFAAADDSIIGTKGSFDMISYNVAGIPIVSADPETGRDVLVANLEIASILNTKKYDIIAVQEDFNYDTYFREELTNYQNVTDSDGNIIERHQTVHAGGVTLGDGLNIFSTYALYNQERQAWEESAGITTDGADELTYKGILLTTIKLADGRYVDIYNIHADAFGDRPSFNARTAQFKQLAKFIKSRSVYDESTGVYDHAVILTGDFNASICDENYDGDAYLVKYLLEPAKLNDAWAIRSINAIVENPESYDEYYTYAAETNLSYSETQGHYDSVERIIFADGNGVDLTCDTFGYTILKGVGGVSLSDHCAVEASFSYEIVEKVQDTGIDHDKENVASDQGLLFTFFNYIASFFRAIGKLLQDWANWM